MRFVKNCIAIAVMLAGLPFASAEQTKPNVIIIFTDDQGYQDLGCYGSPKIKTPNIDKMASEGVKFTDFYVSCSVCTPSRLSLLTGAYPHRMGWKKSVTGPGSNPGLMKPEFKTMPDVMKEVGYVTAMIGKWHLGNMEGYLPTSHGFDSYYGIPYSNDMHGWGNMPFSADAKFREGMTRDNYDINKKSAVPLMRGTEVIEYPVDQTTLTQRYTEEAVKFITANKEQPFFLYLAHSMPHIPLFCSEKFAGKSERGLYGDVIEELDWSTGEILKCLKENGIDENTLVVYTSDNGPWLKKGKAGGSALPLRSGKMTTWEGGNRVPCIMRWPAKIPAGKVCENMATTMDLLPTMASISGGTLPKYKIDGHDITAMLVDPDSESPTQYFFYVRKGGDLDGIRNGKWKIRVNQLFDLETDISEETDVAAQHPELVQKMKAEMQRFAKETKIKITSGSKKKKGKGKKK